MRSQETINADCDDQQRPGQNARQFGGQVGESQSVLQYHYCEQSERRAPQRAAAAEYRGPAKHDSRNRHQLVARSRVRFRLAQMRDVDDSRQTRGESGEQIDEAYTPRHGDAGVPGAVSRETYGVKAAT